MSQHCTIKGCACSVCANLEDFTEFSWYKNLYNSFNIAILQTNEPPHDGQIPSLRANQLEALAELANVDKRIQSIQSLLDEAKEHRIRLQKVIDDYHSALSPVRRLPFEIMHKILENTGSFDSVRAVRSPFLAISNGPWKFNKVSRLWRAVALQSPEFWCNIRIYCTPAKNGQYLSSGLCALINEGVRLSASRGLQIEIIQFSNDDDDDDEEEEEEEGGGEEEDIEDLEIFRTLFAHSAQIQELKIEMQRSSELDDFLWFSRGFAALQRLYIRIGGEECDYGSSILDAFGEAPSLVEVKFDGIFVGCGLEELDFPWDQLHVFENVQSFDYKDLLDVLRLCPRLRKFVCSGLDWTSVEAPPSLIHHSALSHVQVGYNSLSLLQHTIMPSLVVLHVSGVGSRDLSHLTQFISRSECSIQELHFIASTSLQYSFLELLPSLTRFYLTVDSISQLYEFQSVLTPEGLPRLEVLTFRVWSSEKEVLPLCTPQLTSRLVHLIQSRSSLRSFKFCPSSLSPRKSLRQDIDVLRALLMPYNQKLREWIEGGMELYLFLGRSLHSVPKFGFNG
jgi:hypothetical protein